MTRLSRVTRREPRMAKSAQAFAMDRICEHGDDAGARAACSPSA